MTAQRDNNVASFGWMPCHPREGGEFAGMTGNPNAKPSGTLQGRRGKAMALPVKPEDDKA